MVMEKEYNVNLIYRFVGLLLFLLTIAFVENKYVLMIMSLILLFINKKINPLLIFMIIITFLFLTFKFMNNSISFVNVMLMIDYIILFVITTNKEEYITAKNLLLNKKFTYKQLENMYKNEISNKNKELFERATIDTKDDENILLIENRLDSKNKADSFDKLVVNYMRFYKNQNDNYKKLGINKESIIYLIIHVILLVLAVVIK